MLQELPSNVVTKRRNGKPVETVEYILSYNLFLCNLKGHFTHFPHTPITEEHGLAGFMHGVPCSARYGSCAGFSFALQLGLEVSSTILVQQLCVHAVPARHLETPLVPHLHT